MIEIIPNWHPVFVHFTVGLLFVAGILFLIAGLTNSRRHTHTVLLVAEWNFWIGSAMSVATVLAGWYAYNTVTHDTPSHAAMTEHRNWALGTLGIVVILAVWRGLAHRRGTSHLSAPFLITVVLLLGLLGSTAWHGGELVFRYGLGVMSLPNSEGEGHDHTHPDGQEHTHTLPDKTQRENTHGHDHDAHEH